MEAKDPTVIELYPSTGKEIRLKGLYLRDELIGTDSSQLPLVYANFLSSLDGRIAVRSPGDSFHDLPEVLKTPNDFRLFLELHASADCIVTHSGYLRALQEGRLGNVLRLRSQSQFAYLHAWRRRHQLQPAPDIVVLSTGLDFPLEEQWLLPGQQVHLVTGRAHQPTLKKDWQHRGYEVHVLPCPDVVDAVSLLPFLAARKYRTAYLVAGPKLLQSMFKHASVHRFFLTVRHHVMGGDDFHTLIPDSILGDSGGMRLERLYMDQSDGLHRAQWFSEFSMLHTDRIATQSKFPAKK